MQSVPSSRHIARPFAAVGRGPISTSFQKDMLKKSMTPMRTPVPS
jgi:hypothetical protein